VNEFAPVPVAGELTFTALTAGGGHTCGLDGSGAAWCWGYDRYGQVGDGDDGQGDEFAPVQVVGGHTFAALAGGGSHTCGIDTAGSAWCWGMDYHGQVGDGDDGQEDESTPVQVVGRHTFAALGAGYEHTCGLDTSGAAWCWGSDYYGQLGDGDDGQGDEYAPVPVTGGHIFATPTKDGNRT
jgi:alpha-tubulin suppressor-like RCC1 family protein